ncbi:MAG TPA: hypothetical protein VF581_03335 [Flavobacterium sp.]|jgi:hypothetical protein
MRNFTIYLAGFLCLILSQLSAQETNGKMETVQTFEARAKAIANKIEQITKEEKAALKAEVEAVNSQLESGAITNEQADEQKIALAEARARNIETRTAGAQDQLRVLVQEKVDGKITEQDSSKRYSFVFPGLKIKDHTKDTIKGETRTTSQFVFATGFNNIATNNQVAHSDFRGYGSHFYEWGLAYNTRILKNNNLLHAKYGISMQYNNLRPTENRVFVENGDQTNLETSAIHLKDSRFRNVNLVVPVHLEFDFSGTSFENGERYFKTHQTFRFGVGGYAGINLKSKQFTQFETDGHDVKIRETGSFNVNEFIYGLSAYVGHEGTSLYVKYDLNPIFQDNPIEQHNVSIGIRFDVN